MLVGSEVDGLRSQKVACRKEGSIHAKIEVRQSKRTNPPFEQIEIINGSMQADLRLGCQTIPCCVLEAEFSE